MHPKEIQQLRRGFSLLELIIVVFLISLVYFLVFSSLQKAESKPKALTPLNLKSTLAKADLLSGHTTLLCVDKCRLCYLRHGIHSDFQAYNSTIDLTETQAYTLDEQDNLLRLEYGRYNDKKICLIVDFYPNGSSTQIILKNRSGVYFLPAFFGKPEKTDSIEDAKELWLKNSQLLSNLGDFY